MWIEIKGKQHRVYWRTHLPAPAPKKAYEPFATHEHAELFISIAKIAGREMALDIARNPTQECLRAVIGPAAFAAAGGTTAGGGAHAGLTGRHAVVDEPAAERSERLTRVTFDHLWTRYIARQRQLDEGTVELYEGYYRNHFQGFFGTVDIGMVQRRKPLRARPEDGDVLYVDDGWLAQMFTKEKLSNVGKPRPGTHLTIGFIQNVLVVLAAVFDMAVEEAELAFTVNPARGIRLPKQDRRDMHFLPDGNAYLALRCAIHVHFAPLLDFLVGTGARYGEAAGLLVANVQLDAQRPHVEIRLALKWRGKKWKLGRPKTRSSVRRVDISARLVEALRPLIAGRAPDEHVFTMLEGGPCCLVAQRRRLDFHRVPTSRPQHDGHYHRGLRTPDPRSHGRRVGGRRPAVARCPRPRNRPAEGKGSQPDG